MFVAEDEAGIDVVAEAGVYCHGMVDMCTGEPVDIPTPLALLVGRCHSLRVGGFCVWWTLLCS